jgi:glycosyltransferase involved in cell wall biosynthesis
MSLFNSNVIPESKNQVLVLISDTGPSQLIINIIESMLDSNCKPHVILFDSSSSKILDQILALEITCEVIEHSGKSDSLALISNMIKHIRLNNYSIVFASGQHATLFGIFSAFFTRIPKRIYIRHHSDSNFYNCKTSMRLIRGYVFDVIFNFLSTQIVAVSRFVKDQLIDNEYVNSKKVIVINNSVSDYFLIKHRQFRSGEILRIGVISRLTELKGVIYTAEAFSEYYKLNSNCELTIIGEESDSAPGIRKTLSHLPDTAYRFISNTSDTKSFYSEIDIFVHVPIRETAEAFGLVYLEALFSGVHCIFTKSGIVSADKYLSEYCSIVDFQDKNSILQEIIGFANHGREKKELSREIIDRYSPKVMKESYKSIWLS